MTSIATEWRGLADTVRSYHTAYRAGDPRLQGRGAYAFSDVNETDGRDSDGHEGCPSCRAQELRAKPPHRLNRRSALRLAAGAGAAIAVAPHLRSGGARPVDLHAAERVVANPNWPAPAMVTRAQWGANEALRGGAPDYDSVVEKLIVHHTATPSDPSDPAAVVRGIYTHALDGGAYIDIQYNWLIDAQGRLYEGRWAADYPGGAPHTGELNGANVRGGHALNHNSRTIGVCFIGTFIDTSPTDAAIETLVGAPRVEVRALGHRSTRRRSLHRRCRADRDPRQHLRSPRHEAD